MMVVMVLLSLQQLLSLFLSLSSFVFFKLFIHIFIPMLRHQLSKERVVEDMEGRRVYIVRGVRESLRMIPKV